MKNKQLINVKHLMRASAASLFMLALLFPSAIQFSHVFEAHEHTSCKEITTHYHQDIPNCDICDFHFTPFTYEITTYPDFFTPNVPAKVEKHFSTLFYILFKKTNTQLRAPPYFLV